MICTVWVNFVASSVAAESNSGATGPVAVLARVHLVACGACVCISSFPHMSLFPLFILLSLHGLSSGIDREPPAYPVGSSSFQVTWGDVACPEVLLACIFETEDGSTCRSGTKGKLTAQNIFWDPAVLRCHMCPSKCSCLFASITNMLPISACVRTSLLGIRFT